MGGAQGKLDLIFRRRADGRTYLARQFFQLPLQVFPPHYQDEDGTAFLFLLNPSGGVLQHDFLQTDIRVEAGARALVTTPSANRFYRMEDGHARVENRCWVEGDGVLEYLPEHNVPFAQATVYQTTDFFLDPAATLIAFDMVSSGRAERGESFRYHLYANRWRIYVGQRLLAQENCRLRPPAIPSLATVVMGGWESYGTIYLYRHNMPPELLETLRQVLNDSPDIYGGASQPESDLIVVKVLGSGATPTQQAMLRVWDTARRVLLGKAAVRIRKY